MPTLFDSLVPVIRHKLGLLRHIVETGRAHAAEHSLDESALTGFRLFPDMQPFSGQIKIATDIVCGCTARLTGNERLKLDDDAASFEQLIARLDAAIEHLNSQNSDDYAGAESKEIVMQVPLGELRFSGTDFVTDFVFPNLYFHMTTAYNILRHNGVTLGKSDFLMGPG